MKHPILRKVIKHGIFLTLGFDALLGYSLYKSVGLFHHDFTGIASAIPYVSTISLGIVNFLNVLLNAASLGEKGWMAGAFADDILTSTNQSISESMYKKYNNKDFYSQKESDEKALVTKFMKILTISASLDMSKYQATKIKESISQSCVENSLIKEIYIKESINQNTHVIANLFKEAIEYTGDDRNNLNPEANNFFKIMKTLLVISPQLTQADQKTFTHLLKKNNFKSQNTKVIQFMSQKENFSLFNVENQKLFLKVFENKIRNRDFLIETMSNNNSISNESPTSLVQVENDSTPIVIKNEPVVINELSLKSFNQFKQNCQTLYDNKDELNSLLDKVEETLLFKEKMLGFMKHSTTPHIDIELFLNQDVDKLINSFNREVNILHKMQHLSHPDLEKNKTVVLEKMSNRVELIIEKMVEHLTKLHQGLTDDLNVESEVNHKVLSSKM